jgi:hypothetical protein
MSQPPSSPYPQEPYSGQPGSGAPRGYPPPGVPQQPTYGSPPPQTYGSPQPQTYGSPQPQTYGSPQPQTYGSPQPQTYGSPEPQTYGSPQPQAYGTPQQPGYDVPGSYPPPDAFSPAGGVNPQFWPPPVKKKSSALKIALIVVAVIAVLCVGGIGIAFVAAKDKVADVVDATKISVVTPETLGGREKVTDPTLTSSVSSLDSELGKVPGATGSVGAIYGDVAEQDLVMVAAAATISGSAQSRFDQFTQGMSSGGLDVKNLTDTPPGPLGGVARCGDSKTGGVPMAICVWSDNGCIGMIAMMFKQKAALEKEFVAMRGQIEQKR